MNKICTSLEQSKKFIELGIDVNTSDMMYVTLAGREGVKTILISKEVYNTLITPFSEVRRTIPCWSLDALLEVMPQSITKYIESERCQKTFHLNLFRSYYHCCSYCFVPSVNDNDGDNTSYCIGRDNWVDACYEMILKLKEQNLL